MDVIKPFALATLLLMVSGAADARFLSIDPVKAGTNSGQNFNRYYYANGNPYKFTDPDGRRGELFWTAPGQATYTIRWTMVGVAPGFTPAQVNAQIASDFSGTTTIDGQHVTITAQGIYHQTPGQQRLNTVTVIQGPDAVSSTTHHTKGIGGHQVQLGAGGADPATPVVASHELGGHAGGAGDQYAGGIGVNGQELTQDVPGPANVMRDRQGQPANSQTLQEILRSGANTNTCAAGVAAANGGC
jgi:hypothetical protein